MSNLMPPIDDAPELVAQLNYLKDLVTLNFMLVYGQNIRITNASGGYIECNGEWVTVDNGTINRLTEAGYVELFDNGFQRRLTIAGRDYRNNEMLKRKDTRS